MLRRSVEAVTSTTSTLTAATAKTVLVANPNREVLSVQSDVSNTDEVYINLGDTASTSAYSLYLAAAGDRWDGRISGALWRGSVSCYSTAGGKVVTVEA